MSKTIPILFGVVALVWWFIILIIITETYVIPWQHLVTALSFTIASVLGHFMVAPRLFPVIVQGAFSGPLEVGDTVDYYEEMNEAWWQLYNRWRYRCRKVLVDSVFQVGGISYYTGSFSD